MPEEQAQLTDLLSRFGEEHPDLDEAVRSLPDEIVQWGNVNRSVTIVTGTATERSNLAYVGTGTSRNS
jgi:RNase P/RNase MRP subunit p30